MDARIEAGAMTLGVEAPEVEVIVTVRVDDLTVMLESLFDAASVLAFITHQGNSVTAVAPDHSIERKVSALAAMAA